MARERVGATAGRRYAGGLSRPLLPPPLESKPGWEASGLVPEKQFGARARDCFRGYDLSKSMGPLPYSRKVVLSLGRTETLPPARIWALRFCPASSVVERLFCKQRVAGSNPALGSILRCSVRRQHPPCFGLGRLSGHMAHVGSVRCVRNRPEWSIKDLPAPRPRPRTETLPPARTSAAGFSCLEPAYARLSPTERLRAEEPSRSGLPSLVLDRSVETQGQGPASRAASMREVSGAKDHHPRHGGSPQAGPQGRPASVLGRRTRKCMRPLP
jgi:hypothetical protein